MYVTCTDPGWPYVDRSTYVDPSSRGRCMMLPRIWYSTAQRHPRSTFNLARMWWYSHYCQIKLPKLIPDFWQLVECTTDKHVYCQRNTPLTEEKWQNRGAAYAPMACCLEKGGARRSTVDRGLKRKPTITRVVDASTTVLCMQDPLGHLNKRTSHVAIFKEKRNGKPCTIKTPVA